MWRSRRRAEIDRRGHTTAAGLEEDCDADWAVLSSRVQSRVYTLYMYIAFYWERKCVFDCEIRRRGEFVRSRGVFRIQLLQCKCNFARRAKFNWRPRRLNETAARHCTVIVIIITRGSEARVRRRERSPENNIYEICINSILPPPLRVCAFNSKNY